MKRLLAGFFVIAFVSVEAQSNVEKDIIGTWSVVEIVRLAIPPGTLEPSKVDEMKQILREARFEFTDDHHFRLQSTQPGLNIEDGYWVLKGNQVGVGDWSNQGRSLGLVTMTVQQRDGKWFFVVSDAGELEVRKE